MKSSMFAVAIALFLGLGFVSPVGASGARECDVDTSLPCPDPSATPEADFEEPLEPVHGETLPPGCDVEAYRDKDPEASPEPTPAPTPSPDPSASPDPSSEEAACDDDKPYYTGETTPPSAVGGGEVAVPEVPAAPVAEGAPGPKFDGYDERVQGTGGPPQVAANVDQPAEDFGQFTKPATHEPKDSPRVPENLAWSFLGSLALVGGVIWKLAELVA